MGDIVFSLSFVRALRLASPSARIVWVVDVGLVSLIESQGLVDEVVGLAIPSRGSNSRWRRLAGLLLDVPSIRRTIRSFNATISIDLQGLLKSGLIGWLSGARLRLALNPKEWSHLFSNCVVRLPSLDYRAHRPIGSEYRALVARVLGSDYLQAPSFLVKEEARHSVLFRLGQKVAGRQFVVFAPFTTRPQKHWNPSSWRALAELIHGRLDFDIAVVGGPSDAEVARTIFSMYPWVDVFAGDLSIPESAALISLSSGFVGVDTGMTHIAVCLGGPTVALFGSTSTYNDSLSPSADIVWLELECSPCRRNPTCNGRFECMAGISPAMVFKSLQEKMGLNLA